MKFEAGGFGDRQVESGGAANRDPYIGWSDVQRTEEFMETGNAAVLTPELARGMKLSKEMMAEVPGATAEDMAAARECDNKYEAGWDAYFEGEFAKLPGMSVETLDANPARSVLFLFTHRDEPAYTEFVRDFGEDLHDILMNAARSQPKIFSSELIALLDFEHPVSFAATSAALELVRNFYIELLHSEQDDLDVVDNDGTLQARDPERFATITAGSDALVATLRQAIERRAGSYLLLERTREVLEALEAPKLKLKYEDVDAEPFLLAPGVYAGFNHDKSKLYMAPPTYNKDIEAYLRAPGEKKDAWHYDAFYSSVIDAGEVLDGAAFARMGFPISEQDLRDYYFLQSAPIRERIGRDFEIKIENLSIPEQFQLLTFLKTVEKRDASPLLLQATQRLRKMGALRLEDIRGGALEEVWGGSITSEDREAMLRIQRARYERILPPDMYDDLRKTLEEKIADPHVHFYVYRKNDEIITFVRFDAPEQSGESVGKHMASFLTNPDFEGGALGQAMLAVALDEETSAGTTTIYAECDPLLANKYAEYGFRVSGEDTAMYNGKTIARIIRETGERRGQTSTRE